MIKKIKLSKDMDIPSGIETEDTSENIIKWGKKNLYGQYLNYLYYTCAVHQGIINRKVAFILGKGLEETEANKDTVKLFKNVLKGIILSNEISDMYYVKFRLDYRTKETVQKAELISHEKVRVVEKNKIYKIKDDWTDSREEAEVIRTHRYKTDDCQYFIYPFKADDLQFIISGQGKKLSGNYYSEPSYKSGIKSILTDIEAVNYQFSSFKNSFSVGTILNLNMGSIDDPNDKKKIEGEINDLATGSDNADSVLVLYNNGKDTEASVQQLAGSKVHERYNSMSADVRDNILKSHGVISPSLFGFQTGGSFNQSEMDVAYILMKDDYFYQRQQQVLECVNFIDEINGGSADIEFQEFNPFETLEEAKQETTQFKKDACCTVKKDFSDHSVEDVLKVFSQYGIEKESNSFLFSESLNLESAFDGVFKEQSNKFNNAIDIQVLGLIDNGDSFEKIYKALGISAKDLIKIYNRLREGEQITTEGKAEVTRKGKLDIVRSDVAKYEIRYTYEVKEGYGEKLKPTTRDFCRALIEANRMYTRDDITNISLALGMDKDQVWNYRGGWYHNPDTNKNEPSCRHEWVQNLRYIQ